MVYIIYIILYILYISIYPIYIYPVASPRGEWEGPDPPTSVQTPPEIRANPLRSVLYIGGGGPMHVYCNFLLLTSKKIVRTPPFFWAGDATVYIYIYIYIYLYISIYHLYTYISLFISQEILDIIRVSDWGSQLMIWSGLILG